MRLVLVLVGFLSACGRGGFTQNGAESTACTEGESGSEDCGSGSECLAGLCIAIDSGPPASGAVGRGTGFTSYPIDQCQSDARCSFSVNVGERPQALSIQDFNRDGLLDIAAANSGSNNVALIVGDAVDGFVELSSPSTGTRMRWLAGADFNGDGLPDLAVAEPDEDRLSLLLGEAVGFAPAIPVPTGDSPNFVVIIDLDQDGRDDFLVGTRDGAFVHWQSSDGQFSESSQFQGMGVVRHIVAGDLDGDSNLDLVASTTNGQSLLVLLNRGQRNFEPATFELAGFPLSLVLEDLNSDEVLDIACALRQTGQLAVLLGNGDGDFTDALRIEADPNVAYVHSADADRDGNVDLVSCGLATPEATIHWGQGDGTFRAGPRLPVGQNPVFCEFRDLDAKGSLDLMTANYGSNDVTITLNVAEDSP
ncbi:MAG: VCBS repeat-containing protein [Myxococcota bacterium]